jgi:hypothetical protein
MEIKGEPGSMISDNALATRPRSVGANLICGKEAYAVSHDARFIKFASEQEPDAAITYLPDAAKFISRRCGVEMLRFIDETPEAVEKWQALKAEYDTWLEGQNTKS